MVDKLEAPTASAEKQAFCKNDTFNLLDLSDSFNSSKALSAMLDRSNLGSAKLPSIDFFDSNAPKLEVESQKKIDVDQKILLEVATKFAPLESYSLATYKIVPDHDAKAHNHASKKHH